MVAQAIRFLGSDISRVYVTAMGASFCCGGKSFFYPMPVEVAQKIIAFDREEAVEPFDMKLRGGKWNTIRKQKKGSKRRIPQENCSVKYLRTNRIARRYNGQTQIPEGQIPVNGGV